MLYEGLQLGRYRLIRLVGRGGAGEVYLAEDQRFTRQVALKIVQSEDLESKAAREAARLFQREAETIALLNHPHILPVFDFGEETVAGSTFAYLVIPFCPEGSLIVWLRQRKGTLVLQPHEALYIIQQAADALDYAHDQQIIHRDVKPSNFLVRTRKDTPDRPDILLTDFGIARFTQGNANASKTIRGTPKYMAPEQWSGNTVPATDQYALAVMAYELLTNRAPFVGTQEQLMFQHFMTQPQPPSAANPGIPPAIDAVILRAIAKRPEDRFPSIGEFARAFQQAARVVPESPVTPVISLQPPSPYIRATLTPIQPLSTPSFMYATPSISPPHISSPNLSPLPASSPNIEAGSDFHATLYISTTDAIVGANRTLELPGKQHVNVAVPAGAYDGQVIRLQSQADLSSPNARKGDVVVTISVTPTPESAVIEPISDLPQINWRTQLFSPTNWRRYLLFGLALLILIAGLIGLSSFGINLIPTDRTNAHTATSTSTDHTSQATSVAATASVVAQATATAQVNATATAIATIYDPTFKTLPTLDEPLNSNNSSRWDEGGGQCTFTGGSYHVISPTPSSSAQACIARNSKFGDFAFEVHLNILKGSGGGILFRSTGFVSYYFSISQSGQHGYYALSKCAGAGTSCNIPLINSSFSSYINPGQNVIAVVAKGNSIELYINHTPIEGVTDSASLLGQIGVIAAPGSEVVFNNAKVWTP